MTSTPRAQAARLPLTGDDWARSLRGLAAPVHSVRDRRSLPGLLVSIPLFLTSLLVWYLVGRIATYGLFWEGGPDNDAWGGPTLLGAWVVHGLIAFALVVLAMWLIAPLSRLHQRMTEPRGR